MGSGQRHLCQFRQAKQVVGPGREILRARADQSLQRLLQGQVREEEAVSGVASVHQRSGDLPIFDGALAPERNLFFRVDHRGSCLEVT